jgi:hypothetical protein
MARAATSSVGVASGRTASISGAAAVLQKINSMDDEDKERVGTMINDGNNTNDDDDDDDIDSTNDDSNTNGMFNHLMVHPSMHTIKGEHCTNLYEAIRELYSKHGPQVFVKGITPKLLQAGVAHSVTFFAYEHLKEFFGSFVST